MGKKGQAKEKKDRMWIWEVIDFFLGIVEIILYIPRLIFRVMREF